MAPDDDDFEDDLYDDEFDFVDEEDSDLNDGSELDSAADDSDSDDADSGMAAEVEEKKPARREAGRRPAARQRHFDDDADDEKASARDGARRDFDRDVESAADAQPEEEREPAPPTNYRVHVYEYQQFKRTIDRSFTAEDAEAFASEYNRTSKSYSRFAIAGKEDVKPKKSLDER